MVILMQLYAICVRVMINFICIVYYIGWLHRFAIFILNIIIDIVHMTIERYRSLFSLP